MAILVRAWMVWLYLQPRHLDASASAHRGDIVTADQTVPSRQLRCITTPGPRLVLPGERPIHHVVNSPTFPRLGPFDIVAATRGADRLARFDRLLSIEVLEAILQERGLPTPERGQVSGRTRVKMKIETEKIIGETTRRLGAADRLCQELYREKEYNVSMSNYMIRGCRSSTEEHPGST